ncbi:shikimate dehydrogenase [Sulfurovum sp. zt1-1]|uniref:Shikimate dehydrogenase (NADP(+)) n=1 Tax=Sulfurovum zhangzhouensis TaxID=3019067 RepID=A0ABT7R1K1_9BACT|nr:shikimate dehydrogenase [Sulfurovum zhangzhouensis]MDM5272679.1 shikimate dehydrogenase [Sulfurovum zhangzhouensis]
MSKHLFAIFGNPVSHSKSPLMHNLAFRGLKIDACYTRYLLENGGKLKDKFFELGLKGINITVPHKEYAYQACDELDPFAQKVGAVNTIVERDGKLYGYNTDAPGFLKAISEFNGAKKVLFLGAGGTAQSTSMILKEAGYDVTILNRSEGRLVRYQEAGFETYTFENFKIQEYDLVINMTSAGLEDDSLPCPKEFLDEVIPSAKACIDIIYGKDTPFLKLAKAHNKPTKDGADMLLYQGVIAFEYFTDNAYKFHEIIPYMKRAFIL